MDSTVKEKKRNAADQDDDDNDGGDNDDRVRGGGRIGTHHVRVVSPKQQAELAPRNSSPKSKLARLRCH
jgi:hypothetical protein